MANDQYETVYSKYEPMRQENIKLKRQNVMLLKTLQEIADAKNIFYDPHNGLYFSDLQRKATQAINIVKEGEI
jgi:hypothetical protein